MKILIADDSKIMRQRIRQVLLEYAGDATIFESVSIQDTFDSIHTDAPDVVILDLRMPDGSGLDVLQATKENHPSLPIIVFTNYPYPQYRKRCMAYGADHFFDKSTDIEKLANAIVALNAKRPEENCH